MSILLCGNDRSISSEMTCLFGFFFTYSACRALVCLANGVLSSPGVGVRGGKDGTVPPGVLCAGAFFLEH